MVATYSTVFCLCFKHLGFSGIEKVLTSKGKGDAFLLPVKWKEFFTFFNAETKNCKVEGKCLTGWADVRISGLL